MIASTKPEYNLFNYSIDNNYNKYLYNRKVVLRKKSAFSGYWEWVRIHQHHFGQISNRKRYNLNSMSETPDYVTLESYYNCPNNICLDTVKLSDRSSLNQYYTNSRYINMSDIKFESDFYSKDYTGPLAIVVRRIVEKGNRE